MKQNKIARLQSLLKDIGTLTDEADKMREEIRNDNKPKKGKRAAKHQARHANLAHSRAVKKARVRAAKIRQTKPKSTPKLEYRKTKREVSMYRNRTFIDRLKTYTMISEDEIDDLIEALNKMSDAKIYSLLKVLGLTHTYYDSKEEAAAQECDEYNSHPEQIVLQFRLDAGLPVDKYVDEIDFTK